MTETAFHKIPGNEDGGRDIERQMRGLELVRAACDNTCILDLGCAEGMVALEMAKAGAKVVHGVELLPNRAQTAAQLFKTYLPSVESKFLSWDLTRFDDLVLDGALLRSRYDIVLCLAVAQKLANPARFLRLASILCGNIMAVRSPQPFIQNRRVPQPVEIKQLLRDEFDLIQETEGYPVNLTRPYHQGDVGWLGIFKRRPAR